MVSMSKNHGNIFVVREMDPGGDKKGCERCQGITGIINRTT